MAVKKINNCNELVEFLSHLDIKGADLSEISFIESPLYLSYNDNVTSLFDIYRIDEEEYLSNTDDQEEFDNLIKEHEKLIGKYLHSKGDYIEQYIQVIRASREGNRHFLHVNDVRITKNKKDIEIRGEGEFFKNTKLCSCSFYEDYEEGGVTIKDNLYDFEECTKEEFEKAYQKLIKL